VDVSRGRTRDGPRLNILSLLPPRSPLRPSVNPGGSENHLKQKEVAYEQPQTQFILDALWS
jgi:hypothetical protein